MDLATYIDGLCIQFSDAIILEDELLIEKEKEFYSQKVLSVNSFMNFLDYSLMSRTKMLTKYFNNNLDENIKLIEANQLIQLIQCFTAISLRGEYFVKYNLPFKENISEDQLETPMAKFVDIGFEKKKDLFASIKPGLDKIAALASSKPIVKNTVFTGPYSTFEANQNTIIPIKRIGGAAIYLTPENYSEVSQLLSIISSKKSYFCNVLMCTSISNLDALIELSKYFANYVKILRLENFYILNSQMT